MNKNGIIYTIIFTFIIAFFFVFFLALANDATVELVEQNKIVSVQSSVLKSIGKMPADEMKISEVYTEEFDSVPQPGEMIETEVAGQSVLIRYFSGSGLWGTITGIIAVDDKVERIIGLDIISHNETPGLGGRIDEEWFKKQFSGEKISTEGITVAKGAGSSDEDSENSRVDGITGASLTSKSMETIVNNEIEYLKTEGRK
ncbi:MULTISPECIES: FMN-binding protein [unclassified Oceanispirochaeta]|uniref:FMN-binding protein n=1 Tax=unclassified Oceanispirochaeta TaxID=2635722 RepID=UPI000E09C574|nr:MULTISPECIES: FMN-binding protein [unclassified Oceanispirochaeta]MBF9015627.1 FMN-binding protein [Oceanispirochaeta sp. M2]NPD73401.1 FMN-binding protein [Oceanispirochaeta sp. M1]RDG30875.1 FMN-binding protein [Oceanispirochaeta sp. M1]